ncbi:MAG: extracellular solute-binding protein [Treponema sp.]|jgi:ABC-type glycerol-3-phosphate transport system substrate-binding protein|nr:extracellular solute-binding protein [Treponema sp.]
MKKSFRVALFFVVLVLFAAVAAWAGGAKDLKGKTIVIGNFWEDWDANTWKPRNESEELMVDWRKKIQKEYGFSIKEKMVADWNNMLPMITSSVMAGRPAAQAFRVAPDWAMALQKQKLLAPVSDSKAVDLSNTVPIAYKQAAYNQEVARLFTFGGKTYAFAPGGIGASGHASGIYYNKRLYREAGLDPDLPYDMQKAGTWTWDAFFDICKKVTRDRNNTGRIDTYAIPSDSAKTILDIFVYSNGANYIAKDAAGKFVNATGRPEFIEALKFCERLMDEGVMMMRPEGSDYSFYIPAFMDGRIAMILEAEWVRSQLVNMVDDWGYVLPPKGPRAKDYRFADDENVVIIPATYKGEDVDMILTAMNLWVTPTADNWKDGMWDHYRDRRAVEETLTMFRNPRYASFRNFMLIPGLETGEIAWIMWWMNGDPAQLVESVSLKWDALIKEANAIN